MFGDTPADKVVVTQIQTLLSAQDAGKDCQGNLAKVNDLFKTIVSEDARKSAQVSIDAFTSQ